MSKVIVISGPPAAGKTTLSKVLASELNLPIFVVYLSVELCHVSFQLLRKYEKLFSEIEYPKPNQGTYVYS